MDKRKWLSLFIALAMLFSFTAALAEEATEEPAAEEADTSRVTDDGSMPLVVAISTLSQKFTPFFYETGYDGDVVGLTQLGLMTLDRTAAIVFNGIEGEVIPYNGTDYTYYGPANLSVEYDEATNITTYTAKLREDLKFSDGTPLTADDLIFTYYVYLDPSYVGPTSLRSYPIIGLRDYLTQTTSEIYEKYSSIAKAIYAAGLGYTAAEGDAFTQEQYDAFWNGNVADAWKAELQGLVGYCVANYLTAYAEGMGLTPEVVSADEGLKIAFTMYLWGFGDFADGVLTSGTTGDTFDIAGGERPTIDDLYNEAFAKYEGDAAAYFGVEKFSDEAQDPITVATDAFITAQASTEPELAGGVPNVAGIKKLDDYTVQVQTNGYEAPAVYSIFGLSVCPLHYYGDLAQYDYDNNMFGHPYGDLSVVEANTSDPMGAGPYKFVKYENRVVYYEANENYYLGEPAIKYFQFKETNNVEVASGVQTGVIDGGEMSGTKDNFEMLKGMNANGELTGDVITTYRVTNRGYGYIGINADTVRVGDDSGSAESKNLRKALATVLAVYRDTNYKSFYGDAAETIQYPITSINWASPQPTDEGYRIAFSVDVEGNPIYTADMEYEAKYAAALEAAKGFLIAAGYTWDEAQGIFTAAPEGAKLAYEIIIPADGIGDHPSFGVLTDAKAALATIGIELIINDPADSNVLWDTIDAGAQELWCAAWQVNSPDPDMYQTYYSTNIVGMGGTDSNSYHVSSETLDELIMQARQSDDQAYRKALYKAALDEIIDWAVEIPAYQRQNINIASTERVDTTTVPADLTPYWQWLAELQTLQMLAQ